MVQQEIIKAFGDNIKKDLFYNREAFERGEINLLFIIGYSGSGKTTLSKLARKISKVEVVEHDVIDDIYMMSSEEIRKQGNMFFKFFYENDENLDFVGSAENSNDFERIRGEIYSRFTEYAIKYAKKRKNKVIVIEGTRALNAFLKWNEYMDDKFILPSEYLKNVAVIIKGTSLWTSFRRAARRNSYRRKSFVRTYRTDMFWRPLWKYIRTFFRYKRWHYYYCAHKWFKEIKKMLKS